jgi:hypothetical protein
MKTRLTTIVLLACATLFACAPCARADEAGDILAAYEKVGKALVKDDLAAAQTAATALATTAAKETNMAAHAAALARSDSLLKARTEFKTLSGEAVKLAKNRSGWFVMTCSMAHADWVQSDKQVANPYFGSKMPDCGELKE